jgi:hypothetical protein
LNDFLFGIAENDGKNLKNWQFCNAFMKHWNEHTDEWAKGKTTAAFWGNESRDYQHRRRLRLPNQKLLIKPQKHINNAAGRAAWGPILFGRKR